MVGRDTFYVNKKYLKNANYSLALGDDMYVASYNERILMGRVELDASGEALFTKKAVIIPSNVYFVLTNAIKRGTKAFKEGDETPFEILLYKYSKVHHVVAKFEKWENDLEDGEFKFKIQIKWNFKANRSFNSLVEMGLKDAIDTSNIPGDWVWLRRIASFSQEQLEMVHTNLATILEYSFFEKDSKSLVLEFIDYVVSSPKLSQYVLEKLKGYEELGYQSKMKILRYLVTAMFEEKKSPENNGQDYGLKAFMDALSNKVILVFSLFNHRLLEMAEADSN